MHAYSKRVNLVKLDVVDSTNQVVIDLGLKGAKSWTIVHALEQTSGRGRQGNEWISPRGNLFASTLVKPKLGLETWSQLSFAMGLAVADVIMSFVNKPAIGLKWPNDVLIDDLKVAGILLETFMDRKKENSLVIGIGINVAHSPTNTRYGSTCINLINQKETALDDVLDVFIKAMVHWYDIWEVRGFGGIRREWLKRAYGLERRIEVSDATMNYKVGTYKGLSNDGRMVLQEDDGNLAFISSGTVNFL